MAPPPPELSDQTTADIRAVLSGRKPIGRNFLLFAGPAVVASIAYMDPGNFATNIQSGAQYGYTLLWVVLCANIIAMLFQALSAKLGIVTNRSLAEMCREKFPKPVVYAMWVVSEVVAMATDLAELLGGAIAFKLLFGVPLLAGMGITAAITWAILAFEGKGFRGIEIIIGALVLVIGGCYLAEIFIAPINWSSTLHGLTHPNIPDSGALTLAVGIVGATVMPHAVYLHSGLTRNRAPARDEGERRRLLRYSNREVIIALAVAGMVNMAMVMMAAAAFHEGHSDVASIETAYATLTPLLGSAAAVVFLISLLASGVSSSVVGTMAGQMIMQDFVRFKIPIWLRRIITMLPAFAVVAWGVNATSALVISQVILSLMLPVPMIALLIFTGKKSVMGEYTNKPWLHLLAVLGATLVGILNVVLLTQAAGSLLSPA
jgi:manganese transport protein